MSFVLSGRASNTSQPKMRLRTRYMSRNVTTGDHARRTVSFACHPGQNAPKALVGGHDIVLRTHR